MTGITVTGIIVTGITVTGITVTGMTMTGILRMTGVIQTRHARCHTDIQMGWYAGIMNYFPTPSAGLRSRLLILFIVLFVTSSLFIASSYRQLLFIPVIDFPFRLYQLLILFVYTSQRQILFIPVSHLNVYISHQCPHGGERLAGR